MSEMPPPSGEVMPAPDPSGLLGAAPLSPLGGPPIPVSLSDVFASTPEPDQPDPANLLGDSVPMRRSAREQFTEWKMSVTAPINEMGSPPTPVNDSYLPSPAEQAAVQPPLSRSAWTGTSPRSELLSLADSPEMLAAALGSDSWVQSGSDRRFASEAATIVAVNRYTEQFQSSTPEWDWAVFDSLANSKAVDADGSAVLATWNRFLGSPETLSDVEMDDLLVNVNRVANIVDEIAAAGFDLDPAADVDRLVFGVDGPMLFSKADGDFVDRFNVAPISPSLLTASAPTGRATVFLGGGNIGLTGVPTGRTAAVWNGYAPVVTGMNDKAARWLPVGPASMRTLGEVRAETSKEPGTITESFLNYDLRVTDGQHPALTAKNVVMFTMPDDRASLRGVGWNPIEVGRTRIEMPPTDGDEWRDAVTARRFFVKVPETVDPADLASEIEARGGSNLRVYGRVLEMPGWERHREHMWTDGVETFTSISDADTATDPNSMFVFTRPGFGAMPTSTPSGAAMRRQGDVRVVYGDSLVVDVAGRQVEPDQGLLEMTVDGRRVSQFGFDADSATFTPVVDAADENRFVVTVRKVDGGHDVVASASSGFDAALTAGLLVRAAGGSPQRLITPDVTVRFHAAVAFSDR